MCWLSNCRLRITCAVSLRIRPKYHWMNCSTYHVMQENRARRGVESWPQRHANWERVRKREKEGRRQTLKAQWHPSFSNRVWRVDTQKMCMTCVVDKYGIPWEISGSTLKVHAAFAIELQCSLEKRHFHSWGRPKTGFEQNLRTCPNDIPIFWHALAFLHTRIEECQADTVSLSLEPETSTVKYYGEPVWKFWLTLKAKSSRLADVVSFYLYQVSMFPLDLLLAAV